MSQVKVKHNTSQSEQFASSRNTFWSDYEQPEIARKSAFPIVRKPEQ